MTGPLRDRRRAERFAQLLEEASGGRRQHLRSPYDQELAGLVALRHQLVEEPPAPIDPEFRTGLRAMLVATAQREGIGATAVTEPVTRRRATRPARSLVRAPRARTAMVAGVAVGAVAFAGMSTASENAVPGDALYTVKRSSERAQLALASSDVGRAQLYLDFAETRLAEARSLTSGLDRVLTDMDRDTTAGVRLLTTAATNRADPSALDPIDRFVAGQRESLEELSHQVSGPDRARVGESLGLLAEIEGRAADLRSDLELGCPSPTSIDPLGPLPTTCVTLPAPGQLDPPAGPAPAGPAGAPDSGQPARPGSNEQPDQPKPDPAEPDDETEPDRSPTGSTDPDSDSGSGEDETAPAEEEPAEDGGLLSSLNRLIGNLLGN